MKGTGELVTGTDQMPVQANTPFEKITVSTGSKERETNLKCDIHQSQNLFREVYFSSRVELSHTFKF